MSEAIIALRHGFDKLGVRATGGTSNSSLASGLLRDGNIRAELHGLVWNFPTASAKSNRRNNRRKNDSALHFQSPI